MTLVRTDDPLLHGIDLTEVAIASAQQVEVGGAEVLVAGEGAPLLVRGQFAGERFAYFTFDLRDSNLGVQLAFPLLAERLVGQLSGTESAGLALTVGDRLPVPLLGDATVTVTGADARPIEIEPGDPAPRALRPGFVSISVPDRPEIVVAVNPPPDESELAPRGLTAPARHRSASEADATERSMSLLPWVLYPLLAIVLIELVLAWRNVGVGRRQWYLAVGLRTIVAALLVAALFDPVLRRPRRARRDGVRDRRLGLGRRGRDERRRAVRRRRPRRATGQRARRRGRVRRRCSRRPGDGRRLVVRRSARR